jgi:hypothetical protein
MIKEFVALSDDDALEILAALPQEDQDAGYKCRLPLGNIAYQRSIIYSPIVTKEILDIAVELSKNHSKDALALLLALDFSGNDISVTDDKGEDVAATAGRELKRLTAELTDFDAALRILKASKSRKISQKAREAAASMRIAAARPVRRKLKS